MEELTDEKNHSITILRVAHPVVIGSVRYTILLY
jgi:hypothetical protein